MGWILSLVFLIVAAVNGGVTGNTALIASSIFAVAGAIAFASHAEVRVKSTEQKQEDQK